METLEINGTVYVTAAALAKQVGVCRQTLWRWRRRGKIPHGHRHRSGQVLFTRKEAQEVFDYAYQVSPIAASTETGEGNSATISSAES